MDVKFKVHEPLCGFGVGLLCGDAFDVEEAAGGEGEFPDELADLWGEVEER